MATFLQLKERVLTAAQSQNDTLAGQLVNETIAEIVDRSAYPQVKVNRTLTAGTDEYDISTDFAVTDFVDVAFVRSKNAAGTVTREVQPVNLSELNAWREDGSTGQARLYAFRQPDTIILYPNPALSTDTLDVTYVYLPAALSDDTDEPTEAVPDRWHGVIVDGAAARLATIEEADPNLTQMLQGRFEVGLSQYVQTVSERYGSAAKRPEVGAAGRTRRDGVGTRGAQPGGER
jgi:hypothetical protein